MKKKILSVFGTRPEVIKMAPVIKALENSNDFESYICTTSQHRQMQDQMMKLFNLKADFDLNLMKPGQTLTDITIGVLKGLEDIFKSNQFNQSNHFDCVLVHGDTATSTAAGLAAFYAGIPVGHVEAGLRTYNLTAPFPEEANRQLTSRIAKYHFAPTDISKQNLINEKINPSNIFITGNTVIDALLYIQNKLNLNQIKININPKIQHLINQNKNYILITGHRRESFGEGFLNICKAIKQLSQDFPDWHFVYPVHLNPKVQAPVNHILGDSNNIYLIDPVDYAPFVKIMSHCKIVLTDSGGIQEEAPALGKPVLVMRDVTERPEGISAGTAKLVGNKLDNIIDAVSDLIQSETAYTQMANAVNPYGDGQAAKHILQALL